MKEEILKLREQGLSHRKIAKELGCARSTVAYHCNNTTKEKAKERQKNSKNKGISILGRKREVFQREKIYSECNMLTFKANGTKTKLGNATKSFYKRGNTKFTTKDVIDKFGIITRCYITGEKIDLLNDAYEFDHIIPRSKGGDNTLDNLGVVLPEINRAKYNFTIDEFINICKKVLENNGYQISKQQVCGAS